MKKTYIRTLLVTLIAVFVMAQSAFAMDYSVTGASYSFDGNSINVSNSSDLSDTIREMEPGDSVMIYLTYTNDFDEETEWYMSNKIIRTLEETSNTAAGGGYEYMLTNVGPDGTSTELYSSEALGGTDKTVEEGLKQVNPGVTGVDTAEEYFHIQNLKAGESGQTVLYVALDGESQPNAYEETFADLEVSYGVELAEPEGDEIIKHTTRKIVDTGDESNLMKYIAMFAGSLILLVLTAISYRKDRKDGEEA